MHWLYDRYLVVRVRLVDKEFHNRKTIIALGMCMISYNLYLVERIRCAKVHENPFGIITYLHAKI
jgi:hypothetical protein